jgi:2-desacetyl-2-hydroxyethyl bacteriochlorophyllide A dehydrogenase
VLSDVAVEAGRLLSDIGRAAAEGLLAERAREIVRFRYEKAIGHVGGLLSRADFENVDVRQRELFDRYQRAIVVRNAGDARVQELPIPECRPGEVLIKVAYAGMCGTDLEILDGSLGYFQTGLSTYPIIPGHEFSGRVVAAGARAGDWKVGDPVVVECIQSCGRCPACLADNPIGCPERSEVGVMRRNGGFAEYMVSPGRFLHRLAPETSLRAAALCEPTAVVLKGLRRLSPYLGSVSASRPCGIVGGGPIGYLAAAILEQRGYPVVVFDTKPARRAVYRHAEATFDRIPEMGALIEATGDAAALDQLLRRCGAGVPLLLLGFPYGRRDFNFESIVAFDRIVIGSVGSTAADFAEAVDLIGDLPLEPLLTRTVPIAEFPVAVDEARKRHHLKVMLEVDPLLDHYDGTVHLRAVARGLAATSR